MTPYDDLPPEDIADRIDRKTIKQFREQALSLGVLWIIFGVLNLGLAAMAMSGEAQAQRLAGADPAVAAIVAALGLAWLACGVLTLMRVLPAVYVGLALTYLNLLGHALTVNACGIIISVIIVLQAHRVIGFAGKMRRAGVPLDTPVPPKEFR